MWDADCKIFSGHPQSCFCDQAPTFYIAGEVMEKREHLRMAIENLSVDVADGVGFFQGMVSDISRFGICMADLSKRINGDAKRMTIVVSGKAGHFRMDVRPRWYTHGSSRHYVGAEIITVPIGWTEFVMNFEPALHEGAQSEIRL
jgi:hypothetical protein